MYKNILILEILLTIWNILSCKLNKIFRFCFGQFDESWFPFVLLFFFLPVDVTVQPRDCLIFHFSCISSYQNHCICPTCANQPSDSFSNPGHSLSAFCRYWRLFFSYWDIKCIENNPVCMLIMSVKLPTDMRKLLFYFTLVTFITSCKIVVTPTYCSWDITKIRRFFIQRSHNFIFILFQRDC